MPIKKKVFTDIELEFAEQQLAQWKATLDANPLNSLQDRTAWREVKGGGRMPVVVSTIEQQGKYLQETLKNYLALLSEVERMREQEEKKKEQVRGDADISPLESGEI